MKTAITLAEVIIVMTVIGIVFAFLRPFIETIHQRAWNGAKEATAERLKEALRQIEIREGLNSFTNTQAFVTKLTTEYLKTIKVCQNSELSNCFPTLTTSTNTAISMPLNANEIWGGETSWQTMGLVLASGVTFNLAYRPNCPRDGNVCVGAIIDVNGLSSPNRMGHDATRLLASYNSDGSISVSYTPQEVTSTDIPYSSYGTVLYLTEQPDYWSGAIKACNELEPAGEWHLPTKEELFGLYLDHIRYGANEPGFSTSYSYWSSTPHPTIIHYAYYKYFGDETQYHTYKMYSLKVRCVK